MLGEKHSIFTIKYDVSCRFFIVALYKIEGVPSYSYFAESFVNDVGFLNILSIIWSLSNYFNINFKICTKYTQEWVMFNIIYKICNGFIVSPI